MFIILNIFFISKWMAIISFFLFTGFGKNALWSDSKESRALETLKDDLPGIYTFVNLAIYFHGF
jgi:hypothetical protein